MIETKMDKPKAPSQTLNTKNIKLKKSSLLNMNNQMNNMKNKLKTMYSKLNNMDNKCLRLNTKEKMPIMNKILDKLMFKIVTISSFNSLMKTLVL
uniref:NADH dehydrogenase subunit 4L n=1 Tax=Phaonia pallida TaxID=559663 RepID=A0A7D7A9B6_9MUSC|nr:NADH dehydrogenase subunit 4L [Phaonia pallida]